MSYKILHFADLHLDTAFPTDKQPAEFNSWRRAGLRATFTRILNLARERRVDAITIAGDLFEQEYALPETATFLAQEFRQAAPIRIFIAPGEKDPYTNDSFYAQTTWPDNVDIFYQPKLASQKLADGLFLWGAACPAPRGIRLLENHQLPMSGVHLLLLHASEAQSGRPKNTDVYSFSPAQAQAAGFKFSILGHEHIGHSGPGYVYPGSPDFLSAEETKGDHGVALLEISTDKIALDRISLGGWNYRELSLNFTGIESQEELSRQVEKLVASSMHSDSQNVIFTLRLTGIPKFQLDLPALTSQWAPIYHIRFVPQLQSGYDLEALAQEPTVRGLLVQRFQKKLAEAKGAEEQRSMRTALNLALQSLDGKIPSLAEIESPFRED